MALEINERSTDINMFFSSPVGQVNYDLGSENKEIHRLSQNEDDTSMGTSSLLTFADMVIALDQQNESSFDGSSVDDHNYASSIGFNRSRSTSSSEDSDFDLSDEDDEQSSALLAELDSITSDRGTTQNNPCSIWHTSTSTINKSNYCYSPKENNSYSEQNVKSGFSFQENCNSRQNVSPSQGHPIKRSSTQVKRSSSVENIQCLFAEKEAFFSSVSTTDLAISSVKTSPRKSCSFEEVNADPLPLMKSSKSTENIQKGNVVSHQLHRIVNDNLEFPSWPRKADHTYATATWDGTAASHSLFEQESRTDASQLVEQAQGCQEMDVSESSATIGLKVLLTDLKQESHHKTEETVKFSPVNSIPREDHTYTVKSKTVSKSILQAAPNLSAQTASKSSIQGLHGVKPCKRDWLRGNSNPTGGSVVPTGTIKTNFSCATFPRPKMRDDHTYFHSGLNKKDCISSGGREWVSEKTVMVMEFSENNNSVFHVPAQENQQSISRMSSKSGKRDDHNYSTSA